MNKEYTIELFARLSELSKLRKRFEDIFNQENLFDDLTRKNILLALTELFVNVVKHGGLLQTKIINFNVIRREMGLEITLYDEGNSYNPDRIKPPEISELPEGGFGVFLVKSLMDSFNYQPKTKTGKFNITQITKNA
jgi:serine/threonine-protein kinase RsbW